MKSQHGESHNSLTQQVQTPTVQTTMGTPTKLPGTPIYDNTFPALPDLSVTTTWTKVEYN